jgi:AcrR family transcriptional regulator
MAGRALLETRDIDAMSIAELARAIGMSVGSFYGRFKDKESFFAVLQQQITAEWQVLAEGALAPPARGERAPAATVTALCGMVIGSCRRDAGFLRAALKHASTHPSSWTPIKAAGQVVTTAFVTALGSGLAHLRPADRHLRVRFAMQMIYGTAVNAVLNDPGPLLLANPRLERELARVVCQYLGLPAPAGNPRKSPPSTTQTAQRGTSGDTP